MDYCPFACPLAAGRGLFRVLHRRAPSLYRPHPPTKSGARARRGDGDAGRERILMRVLTFAALALFFACVAVGAAEVEAGKPPPAPKPPAAKPGVIAGVISDERGNVIRDAKVRVIISGISGSFG